MCGKGISTIEYNYLNLPIRITFSDGRKIEFIYDATGKNGVRRLSMPMVHRIIIEINLDDEFISMGVPKSNIVLGFLSPKTREYTDYALA